MTINDYQQEALRTAVYRPELDMLEEALIGLSCEAAECLEVYNKHKFRQHTLNKEDLAYELGDVAWYIAFTAWVIGYNLEQILEMNVDKREQRYPAGKEPWRALKKEGKL